VVSARPELIGLFAVEMGWLGVSPFEQLAR
jgi:hypothetical protein